VYKGKQGLLLESLIKAGVVDGRDFHLLEVTSTMFQGKPDKNVFVVSKDGSVAEVAEHSYTINMFRDRPESEWLLVILNKAKAKDICTLARKGAFVSQIQDDGEKATRSPRGIK